MLNFTSTPSSGNTILCNSRHFLQNYLGKAILPMLVLLLSVHAGTSQTNFSATYTFGANGDVLSFAYNGTSYVGITPSNITKNGVPSSGSSGNFRASAWPTGATNGNNSFTGSVDLAKYFEFSIAPVSGYKFTITSIDFGVGRSGTGPRQWQWRGSADTYTAPIDNYTNLASGFTNASGILTNTDANSNWTGNSLNVASSYTDQTSTATFRIYGFNSESGTGTGGLQGPITITGTFVSVVSNYNVLYNGNTNDGGTAPVDPGSPHPGGSNVTVLGPGTLTKIGYTFTGWNTAADGSGTAYAENGSINNISANTTLYAQWVINTYNVTYNGNGNDGGTAPVDGNNYTHGSTVTLAGPGTLSLTGFSFNGWNTAANGSGTAYAGNGSIPSITANTTLYAQWVPSGSYTVTYNGNGSDNDLNAPVDGASPYAGGSNVTVMGPGALVKTGYTFTGWDTQADGSGTDYAPGGTIPTISASVTLFAQWQINTYTVTYNGNGSDNDLNAPVDPGSPYVYNTNVTVLGQGLLTKANYNFTGWNTAADGSGSAYAAAGTITGIAANTTLYAQWAIITYTVTYDGNTNSGGTAPVDPSSPYAIGTNVTVLGQGSLVKAGYTFTGWNTSADGSGSAYAEAGTIPTISANTTLFAQWAINQYTVTYNGNSNTGGSVPVDGLSPYNFGSTVTVLANTGSLVRTGFVFVGWNTLADGTGINYAATGSATFTLGAANVVLYAKWSQPFYESFSYTAGDNIGGNSTATSGGSNNNWTSHSNTSGNSGVITVTAGSLSYTGLQASTGNKIRFPGNNSAVPRDINRAISFAGATVCYYSLLINVEDNTQLTAGGEHFFGFGGASGTNVTALFSRLFIKSANGGANFRLGITNSSGGSPTVTDFATDLSFGTTYLVVVKHDFNGASADISTLWVNPASLGGSEPVGGVTNNSGTTGQTTFASVYLRNTTSSPKADIDEIRAGLSWADVTPPGISYQLTVNAGTGGTISAPAVSPATVAQGASTTITAVPDAGYLFNGWTVQTGTASITNASLASTTVILNSGDATIQANFIPDTYTITASAGTGGTISPNGAVVVNAGTSPGFTITADGCSEITDIIVDGVSLNAYPYTSPYVHTFNNVAANHTISASFSSLTFTQWTGAASTNWNDAANWTACVPNASLYVYIPGNGDGSPVVTQQPVLTADASTGDLEMGTNASISIGSNTLTINGLYADNGNASLIGSNASNLVINGTNNVTFLTLSSASVLTLKNLSINGGTTTLTTPVHITGGTSPGTAGVVSVASGAVLAADGFLTLGSNQFGTASVGQGDVAGGYVTGNVTVERFIPNNNFRSWRLLSVPVTTTQTIRQAWQEGGANPNPKDNNLPGYGTQITGVFGTQAAAAAAGFDSTSVQAAMLRWNGSAWSNITSTNQPINNFNSYFLYVRGDRSLSVTGMANNSNATTLRTTGTLYTGNQLVSVPAGSFTLVPNLHASALNFSGLSRLGVNDVFYIWDSKKLSGSSLGAYQTFSGTNGYLCLLGGGSYALGQPNTVIESGQSFFVVGGAGGSITLNESAKITGSNGLGFRPATAANRLVKIDSRLYAGNDIVDANVVVFDNAYPAAVGKEDAIKIDNPGVNFAIRQQDKKLAIEGRQVIEEVDEIAFAMWNLKQQQYRLEFVPSNMAAPGMDAVLEDAYLRTSTPVSLTENTSVSFTIDANPASAAANRFKIVLVKARPVANAKTGIAISPNPVEAGAANLRFVAQAAGRYSVRILSVTGQVVFAKMVVHPGGSSTQVLNLQGLTGGTYTAEITSPDKTKTVQLLLVK